MFYICVNAHLAEHNRIIVFVSYFFQLILSHKKLSLTESHLRLPSLKYQTRYYVHVFV